MNRRQEQAFNDGKLAFSTGKSIDSNPRQSPEQRKAWRDGFEEARRMKRAETLTPQQREEGIRVVRSLKAWAEQSL